MEEHNAPSRPSVANAKRLKIQKIVLENFKSYAGVKQIGPFHKCFSSVVGPNGSGKSNVIDAIQFVLGKKNNKLRLKRVSELIHNSENFKNLTFCRVSIHFVEIMDLGDNDEMIVEDSEFVVTRTAEKNNQSKYFIDEKKCTLSEVRELFLSKGFDIDGDRFLILQGEVEQISLMKPLELLDYLEDIIGTCKYKEPIEEAFKQIEDLNEQRTSKLNRVKSAEKEKDNLEGAKLEAEEYLRRKRQAFEYKHVLLQIQLHRDRLLSEEKKNEKEQLEEQYNEVMQEKDEAEKQESQITTEYQRVKAQYNEIAIKVEKANNEFAAFDRKDAQYQQNIIDSENMKEQLEKSISENTEKLKQLEKKLKKYEKEKVECDEELETLKPSLEEAEQTAQHIRSSVQSKIEPIRVKIEEKNKQMLPWSNHLSEVKHKIDVAQSEIDLIEKKSRTSQEEQKTISESIKKFEVELSKKQKEKKALAKALSAASKRVPELKQEVESLSQQSEKMEGDYQKYKSKFEQLKEASKSAASRSLIYQELMKAKERGEIPGICDRLGNLGSIDKKYDVAISTSCLALNQIVVKDTETGKQCVEYLRKNKLGSCNFILLDKLQQNPDLVSKSKKAIETPEGVPRLYDLVKVRNAVYKIAFYNALRNTLVANNLEQATRIAYNQSSPWRIVTLTGELIELTGTMSGGGKKVLKGGMAHTTSADVSAKEIKRAEKDAEEIRAQLEQVNARRDSVKDQLSSLETELANQRYTFSKLEMEEKSIQSSLEELEGRLGENKSSTVEEDDRRVSDLQEQITSLHKSAKESEKKKKKIEEELSMLQAEIDEIDGPEMKKQKLIISDLTRKIDEISSKATTLKAQIQTTKKNIEKTKKQIKKDEKAIEEVDSKIEHLKTEMAQLEEEAAEVHSNLEESKELLQERRKKYEMHEKKLEDIKSKVDSMKESEIELKNQLDDVERQYADICDRVKDKIARMRQIEGEYSTFTVDDNDVNDKMDMSAKDESDAMDVDEDEEKHEHRKQNNPRNLKKYADKELESMKESKFKNEVLEIEKELEKMNPNMSAIRDFKNKAKEYEKRMKELDMVNESRSNAQKSHDDLRKRRLEEFMAGFNRISLKLKEIYQMITLGGDAELELVDSLDPFSEGLVFSVRPPKKSWKNICNLSGGEKTLSSLSLIFALHYFKPTPIYVMDEIDAALDFKNVSIIANYIKERTKNAQFIIISLRNNMFELADILVGIYKTNNCTKSVTVNPHLLPSSQQNIKAPVRKPLGAHNPVAV